MATKTMNVINRAILIGVADWVWSEEMDIQGFAWNGYFVHRWCNQVELETCNTKKKHTNSTQNLYLDWLEINSLLYCNKIV